MSLGRGEFRECPCYDVVWVCAGLGSVILFSSSASWGIMKPEMLQIKTSPGNPLAKATCYRQGLQPAAGQLYLNVTFTGCYAIIPSYKKA